ncbi:MAG: heme ABC exporter ATP-binding protein CcmA [Pseudomonadota bacterium]|nr:heme ABC exporter ATP-binding protein CcmA [Pseudomonadota bacterium]
MQLIGEKLTCVRGGRTVFSGLSFKVAAGDGLLLTGPNGAGKSSLLRMIAGLLRPQAGTLRLSRGPAERDIGELCHFIGHANGIKRVLTVEENLRFWSGYLGGEGVDKALATLGLESIRDVPAALLSAGQARRLALARLLVAPRPLWLLDEPTVSLDAASQATFARLIRAHLASRGIVAAATHLPLGATFRRKLTLGKGGSQ